MLSQGSVLGILKAVGVASITVLGPSRVASREQEKEQIESAFDL